ncbi:MAG TPA: acyl carrier protein [Gemmatimonadales bacterium]|jgi:acyl carrier protein
MTREEIHAGVLECLESVVPELDPKSLEESVPFREQLDMDSMDALNFVVALDERLGVAVAESDYSKIATLESCVDYLVAALAVTEKRP